MKIKKATIKDVAKRANVSIATVSYVINNINKVIPETKERVLEAIEFLGYTPNGMARSLVKNESNSIGLLIPTKSRLSRTILMDNPFYQEFLSGVEFKARDYGFTTAILANEDAEKCIDNIKRESFAGIIVLGLINSKIYNYLIKLEIPIVVIDQEIDIDKYYYINTDNEFGAYSAVKHLIEKGHKKIGLLTQDIQESIVHRDRYRGYKKALEESLIEVNEEFLFIEEISYEGGVRSADKVYDKINEVTAIFSISDIMAMGLIKGLVKKNINVPKDLSVIGFDDIKYSKYFIPELTTISQDIFYKGEKSVEIIYKANSEIELEKKYITPIKLIVRESVYDVEE